MRGLAHAAARWSKPRTSRVWQVYLRMDGAGFEWDTRVNPTLPHFVAAFETEVVLPSSSHFRGTALPSHNVFDSGSSNTNNHRVMSAATNCAGVQYGAANLSIKTLRVSGAVRCPECIGAPYRYTSSAALGGIGFVLNQPVAVSIRKKTRQLPGLVAVGCRHSENYIVMVGTIIQVVCTCAFVRLPEYIISM